MEITVTTVLVWVILFFCIKEAFSGKQRNFSRLGLGILFLNMIFVNINLYGQDVGGYVVFIGLAILSVMAIIRAYHYFCLQLK